LKQLIIAEKPSLAKNVVNAIPDKMQRKDGYYEGKEYVVSYGFGHLFELKNMGEYTNDVRDLWRLDNIPYCPPQFEFRLKKDPITKEIDEGIKVQFHTLCALMNRNDIDSIIHCGDADREGEVIIRLIIQNGLKQKKPVMRLWLPEQTEETIRKGLKNLQPDHNYDSLYEEGLARTYIDWLYGINLTRYVSLKSKADSPLRVGRVLSAIVQAIYEREIKIQKFVPKTYFLPESKEFTNGEEISLTTKQPFETKEAAEKYCLELNKNKAIVTSLDVKKGIKKPGKLFSLSKLQGELGKKYKMPMKTSLSLVQSLYEKGYVTYPRTNTEYLAENEKGKIDKILTKLRMAGYSVELKDSKTVFDDSKIESHSALTPTIKEPSGLSEDESKVYDCILKRFLAVFCSLPCEIEITTMIIMAGKEQFCLKGEVIVNKGWLIYEENSKSDKLLPKLHIGDQVNIHFQPIEKQTSPPKKYNLESLNNFMKNPFQQERKSIRQDDEQLYQSMLEGVEIGTEATRTGIIDNAVTTGYISLKNNIYSLEPLGEYVIKVMHELEIDMSKEKTVELSKLLKRVYKNEVSVDQAIEIAVEEINCFFRKKGKEVSPIPEELRKRKNIVVGECPICKKPVVERKGKNGVFYSCTGYHKEEHEGKNGCSFSLPGSICSEAVSPDKAKELIEKGKIKLENMVSKQGKKFSAIVKLDISQGKADIQFIFPKKKYGKGHK